ncbi:EF-P lysine aminoacylase EpmA [Chloroflexota bacterium]
MEDDLGRLIRIQPNLQRRALIHNLIRVFFTEQGFLEVDTPVRVPAIAPEPYITPFRSEGWYLSTSPELHMKRMLAAGYQRLFQLSRCFRNGERGLCHNPEFTMLEWYRTGSDYRQMIIDTEQLLATLAAGLGISSTIIYLGQLIDISLPWPRVTVRDAFVNAAGWDPTTTDDPEHFDTDLITKVIPGFAPDRPTVFTDYPAAMAALSRIKPGDEQVAERTEVFIGGLELANAYSELVDTPEQESRFREAIEQIHAERGLRMAMPEKFLRAMPYLPECAGAALGIDRLVMLLCNADAIDDVIPFTSDTV